MKKVYADWVEDAKDHVPKAKLIEQTTGYLLGTIINPDGCVLWMTAYSSGVGSWIKNTKELVVKSLLDNGIEVRTNA